jgi:biotin/methionine sulfoxide reductase
LEHADCQNRSLIAEAAQGLTGDLRLRRRTDITVSDDILFPTSSHWGNFRIATQSGQVTKVLPYKVDAEPSPIGQSLLDHADPKVRVAQPMIREGYLNNPTAESNGARGTEPFVAVSWDQAITLAADRLKAFWRNSGPNSIYGGSYGWASAGRFHHAQSQIHRFLRLGGGYVSSVNSYSAAAAEVIIKHILGFPLLALLRESPSPEEIAQHSKTMILFGGAAIKNAQINAGGLGRHSARAQLRQLRDAGVRIVNVSPLKDDTVAELEAQWVPCRPGSDTAIMLGMAHTLYIENRYDKHFIDEYTTGFHRFVPYLTGETDGEPKTARWASELSGVPEDLIVDLARAASNAPSLISVSWSLQRQIFGEQTWWMVTVLGAMLGYIGRPGAGIGYGYGCIHNMGFGSRKIPNFRIGAFGEEVGERITAENHFIPVARLADMLEKPGESFNYNGQRLTYPEIKLIYWAGGNPYHHHQDLNRLRRAWQKPQTIIVNESFWTATAKHADIVFPISTFLERNDVGGSAYDEYLTPMHAATSPFANSRSDYAVFSALAEKLGFAPSFTQHRDEMAWVRSLYEETKSNAAAQAISLPNFDEFWQGEQISFGDQLPRAEFMLEKFRQNPNAHPLRTPSGKIEIFSEKIDAFQYPDCRGHPRWYDRDEWLGNPSQRYPLHLVSNQPKHKLHSQLDHARSSQVSKISGRETVRLSAADAVIRGLKQGDIVKIFNARGACLAGVLISEAIMPGVIELPTGAWFDSQKIDGETLEVHGNPNALTPDMGTSMLAQGCSAHTCMVEIEKYDATLPHLKAFEPPATITHPPTA